MVTSPRDATLGGKAKDIFGRCEYDLTVRDNNVAI